MTEEASETIQSISDAIKLNVQGIRNQLSSLHNRVSHLENKMEIGMHINDNVKNMQMKMKQVDLLVRDTSIMLNVNTAHIDKVEDDDYDNAKNISWPFRDNSNNFSDILGDIIDKRIDNGIGLMNAETYKQKGFFTSFETKDTEGLKTGNPETKQEAQPLSKLLDQKPLCKDKQKLPLKIAKKSAPAHCAPNPKISYKRIESFLLTWAISVYDKENRVIKRVEAIEKAKEIETSGRFKGSEKWYKKFKEKLKAFLLDNK